MVRSTLGRCYNSTVKDRIKSEEFELTSSIIDFNTLVTPKQVKIEHITQSLINEGIRIQDAENITSTINRIIKLTDWYRTNDYNVLEHEIRTFLIVPLLISLGWSEQKIKIEYNKIDIAIFKRSFKGDYKTHPYIIIEAKRFDDGLSFTHKQPSQYSNDYADCKKLVTTNGFRYKVFEKNDEGKFLQTAYLSLLNLREHHYLDKKIGGAVKALLKMSSFSGL